MPARKTDEDTEEQVVDQMVRDLSADIKSDREKLTKVLDRLVKVIDGNEGLEAIAVAESVAKLGDSLTKQNHLRVEALKILAKRKPKEEDPDADAFDDIGSAFDFNRSEN